MPARRIRRASRDGKKKSDTDNDDCEFTQRNGELTARRAARATHRAKDQSDQKRRGASEEDASERALVRIRFQNQRTEIARSQTHGTENQR